MDGQIIIQLLITAGTILGGVWALFAKLSRDNAKAQKELFGMFIDYTENKNGHMERIANRFADTIEKYLKQNAGPNSK